MKVNRRQGRGGSWWQALLAMNVGTAGLIAARCNAAVQLNSMPVHCYIELCPHCKTLLCHSAKTPAPGGDKTNIPQPKKQQTHVTPKLYHSTGSTPTRLLSCVGQQTVKVNTVKVWLTSTQSQSNGLARDKKRTHVITRQHSTCHMLLVKNKRAARVQ